MNIGSITPDRCVTFIAGLFVAFGVVVLAAWLVVKVGQLGLRGSYYTVVADVTGLRIGTPVQIAGYRIGVIRSIRPASTGRPVRFRVDLLLDSDWPLPRDSTVTPAAEGLLSAPILELRLGSAEERIAEGGEIPAKLPEPGLDEVVRAVIADDLRPTLQSIRTAADTLDRLVVENVPPLLGDARQILADTRQAVGELAAAVPGLRREAERLAGGLGETGEMLGAVSGPETRQRIEGTLADLRSTAAELERLTRGAQALLRDTRAPLGEGVRDAAYSLQSLASSIGLILANLERTSQDLSALVAELRAQPSAIFRRGQPEEPSGSFRPR